MTFLATYGATATGSAAVYLGGVRGEVAVGVVLALLAGLALAVRAGMAWGRPTGGRRLAALTAVMVMLSLAGGGVGTVAAQDGQFGSDCSKLDEFIYTLSIGLIKNDCDPSKLAAQMEEIQEIEGEQTEIDLYNGLYSQHTQSESWAATSGNALENKRTVAWSKAEAAAIEAMENGSTRSEAEAAATEAVQDYYSIQQRNLLASWNSYASSVLYVVNAQENESEVGEIVQTEEYLGASVDEISAENKSLGLVNGTAVTVQGVNVYGEATDSTYGDVTFYADGLEVGSGYDGLEVLLAGPQEGYSDQDIWTIAQNDGDNATYNVSYPEQWVAINNQSSQMAANVGQYVDAVYEANASGDLNASYVSASTMAQEYSTQYNETGYYAYAVSALASSGTAAPGLNGTGLMEVHYDGATFEGMVMSQEPPASGSWETGESYNPSNISGLQYIITTDGEQIDLDGPFSIGEMTNADGDTINETTVQRYSYETANSSDYVELSEDLAEVRSYMERQESNVGGGGGGGLPDLGFGGLGVPVILVAGGYLLLRDE